MSRIKRLLRKSFGFCVYLVQMTVISLPKVHGFTVEGLRWLHNSATGSDEHDRNCFCVWEEGTLLFILCSFLTSEIYKKQVVTISGKVLDVLEINNDVYIISDKGTVYKILNALWNDFHFMSDEELTKSMLRDAENLPSQRPQHIVQVLQTYPIISLCAIKLGIVVCSELKEVWDITLHKLNTEKGRFEIESKFDLRLTRIFKDPFLKPVLHSLFLPNLNTAFSRRMFGQDISLQSSEVILVGLPDGRVLWSPRRGGIKSELLCQLNQPVSGISAASGPRPRQILIFGCQGQILLVSLNAQQNHVNFCTCLSVCAILPGVKIASKCCVTSDGVYLWLHKVLEDSTTCKSERVSVGGILGFDISKKIMTVATESGTLCRMEEPYTRGPDPSIRRQDFTMKEFMQQKNLLGPQIQHLSTILQHQEAALKELHVSSLLRDSHFKVTVKAYNGHHTEQLKVQLVNNSPYELQKGFWNLVVKIGQTHTVIWKIALHPGEDFIGWVPVMRGHDLRVPFKISTRLVFQLAGKLQDSRLQFDPRTVGVHIHLAIIEVNALHFLDFDQTTYCTPGKKEQRLSNRNGTVLLSNEASRNLSEPKTTFTLRREILTETSTSFLCLLLQNCLHRQYDNHLQQSSTSVQASFQGAPLQLTLNELRGKGHVQLNLQCKPKDVHFVLKHAIFKQLHAIKKEVQCPRKYLLQHSLLRKLELLENKLKQVVQKDTSRSERILIYTELCSITSELILL